LTDVMGIDIAWARPDTSQILASGAHFVARYLSPDSTKNITASEVTDYQAHGLDIIVVWEGAANRMLGGYAAGVADAQTADAQRKAVGLPDDTVIYFACDFDASGSRFHTINQYMDGVNSVIGISRSGFYGGYYAVESVAASPATASFFWQTMAWSDGKWSAHANIRQEGTLFSGSADYDYAQTADYGQYPRPKEDVLATLDADDLKNIAAAVWNFQMTNVATKKAMTPGGVMAYVDYERDAQTAAIKADLATIASIGGPSAAQITAAVEAGYAAMVANLLSALKGSAV